MQFKIECTIIISVLYVICNIGQSFAQEFSIYQPLQNKSLIHKFHRVELLKYDKENLLSNSFSGYEDSIKAYFFNDSYWFFWKPSSNEKKEDYCYELFALRVPDKKISQITKRNFGFSTEFLQNLNDLNEKLFIVTLFNLDADNSGEIGVLLIDQDNFTEGNYIPIRKSAWLEKISIQQDRILIEVQPFILKYNFWSLINFLTPKEKSPKWKYEATGKRWEYILNADFVLVSTKEAIN